MSQRLKDHISVLKRLVKGNNKKRKKILQDADPELLKCISEIALNTINSNVPLTDSQYKKLSRYKNILRELASKNVSLKKKKHKLVKQAGGCILPLLIPIIGSVIANLISS